jgi:hypothetical protein
MQAIPCCVRDTGRALRLHCAGLPRGSAERRPAMAGLRRAPLLHFGDTINYLTRIPNNRPAGLRSGSPA